MLTIHAWILTLELLGSECKDGLRSSLVFQNLIYSMSLHFKTYIIYLQIFMSMCAYKERNGKICWAHGMKTKRSRDWKAFSMQDWMNSRWPRDMMSVVAIRMLLMEYYQWPQDYGNNHAQSSMLQILSEWLKFSPPQWVVLWIHSCPLDFPDSAMMEWWDSHPRKPPQNKKKYQDKWDEW